MLALLPHAILGAEWSNVVNLFLNFAVLVVLIWRFGGGWQAAAMTFLSPAFLALAYVNNMDWVPALAFLLPPTWGLPLLALKPQAVGGAALIWWKRSGFSLRLLLPLALIVALSFVVWGFWPARMAMLPANARQWNFAPWPFGLPLGIYLLYRAYRSDDDVLAAAATPFLVPYFLIYSLTPLLALLACRRRHDGLVLWVGMWLLLIVEGRHLGMFF